METLETTKKTDTSFTEAKVGEIFSETQFYTLTKKVGNKCELRNETGEAVTVDSNYVERCLHSADQFSVTTKLNKTDLANQFLNSKGVAMTVSFNKQVKESDVVEEVMSAYTGSTFASMKESLKKAVKKGLTGEERIIRGFFYSEPNEFGRINFVDMEIKKEDKGFDNRVRQVDPRNLNFVIVRGVKYVLK